MHPDLEDWDEAYLTKIAAVDFPEKGTLEKKGAGAFDPAGDAKKTKEEIGKQVCAFANAGGGFLVYGIDKNGGFDQGVQENVARTSVKAWIEQIIPKLTVPSITDCEARFVQTAGHQSGRGILVVSIKLSERRPHWTDQNGVEVPYIRTGEHSDRMRLQTFQDIHTRSSTSLGEVISLGVLSGVLPHPRGGYLFQINPIVELVAGPICEKWCLHLKLPRNGGSFFDAPTNGTIPVEEQILLTAPGPLFPKMPTRAGLSSIALILSAPFVEATLCVGSALPVRREIPIDELFKEANSYG